MKFPTGGRARERKLIRFDYGADSTVWMEEECCLPWIRIFLYPFFLSTPSVGVFFLGENYE